MQRGETPQGEPPMQVITHTRAGLHCMLVTLETSHRLKSPLNDVAPRKVSGRGWEGYGEGGEMGIGGY